MKRLRRSEEGAEFSDYFALDIMPIWAFFVLLGVVSFSAEARFESVMRRSMPVKDGETNIPF